MYQLNAKIERLLKSALFKETKACPCKIFPCLVRLYSDGAGRLIATNGRVLVAVRNGCNWPLGLYKPPFGSYSREWVRDEAMETEMAAKLQGRIYPDWEAGTIPTGPHDLYSVQRNGVKTLAQTVQAACVQSGVCVDWCQWGRVLEALTDVKYGGMNIKCFGPDRAVVVDMHDTGFDVLAVFTPFKGDMRRQKTRAE